MATRCTATQRPLRTTDDVMGMGDRIHAYNDQLEGIMQGTYGAFGMGDLLGVRDRLRDTGSPTRHSRGWE